jgi:hypothetical protein
VRSEGIEELVRRWGGQLPRVDKSRWGMQARVELAKGRKGRQRVTDIGERLCACVREQKGRRGELAALIQMVPRAW